LNIPGKSRVALVGPSGSGKTTLLRLLCRLHEPAEDSIFVCGQDVTGVNCPSLRAAVTYVPQSTVLLNGTVRRNLLLGVTRSVSDDEIWEKAAELGLDKLLRDLGGLEKSVGERGERVSGGQKHAVALLRAALRNTPLLLLDECTAALDTKNEEVISRALKRLARGRTTLVVTHRLSSLRDFDYIYVMNEGCVVEEGDFRTLAASAAASAARSSSSSASSPATKPASALRDSKCSRKATFEQLYERSGRRARFRVRGNTAARATAIQQ
uniref:Uncharacterized protein LOC113795312 n=1 Tax=Dermatophagoides pteronyssinus TaxID=6956 RepID=A0A6P6Y7D2_DERPT